jgi:hypothetical protein
MAEYKCPKCGGFDYFMSQRNVVKGMGWAQRGSIKSIPVCRVCDEIMQGAQIGLKNWEDYGSGRSNSKTLFAGLRALSKRTKKLFNIFLVGSVLLLIEMSSAIGGIFGVITIITLSVGFIGTSVSLLFEKSARPTKFIHFILLCFALVVLRIISEFVAFFG